MQVITDFLLFVSFLVVCRCKDVKKPGSVTVYKSSKSIIFCDFHCTWFEPDFWPVNINQRKEDTIKDNIDLLHTELEQYLNNRH